MYDGKVDRPGRPANLEFIPDAWMRTRATQTTYREVIKPYCRTCHVSQVAQFAFLQPEDFMRSATDTTKSVCVTNQMPIAEATLELFWRSPARGYLMGSLGLSHGCAPR
jgi:hypothetical protein